MANAIPLTAADPTRLGGWELLGRIGTGGQGVVYLGRPARQAVPAPRNGPDRVAVKLLHAQLLGNTGARERFVRELALLQRVAGFCTAQMLDADMAGDRPYIVSEYVPGRSLRLLVEEEGPRTGADLDRLAISSVTALSAIHRAGIVHRDFKPQNVLMGPDGPRVIDFGVARAFDTGATLTSQVVGTPAYMAPEQFTGRVGPSTDLFAWATTMLFAATGRHPFAGGPLPAVMYRIMNETPDLRVLPAPLADVAAACFAKNPKDRPTTDDVLLWLLGDRAPRSETAPNTPPLPPTTAGADPGTFRELPARTTPFTRTTGPGRADSTSPPPVGADPGGADPGTFRELSPAPFTPNAARSTPGTGMPPPPGTGGYGESDPGTVRELSPGVTPLGGHPGAGREAPAPPVGGRSGGTDPGVVREMSPGGTPFGAPPGAGRKDRPETGAPFPPGAGGTDPRAAREMPPGGTPFSGGPRAGWAGEVPDVGPGPRTVARGAALGAGLVLAGVLAALDVVALAVLIAVPSLTERDGGALLPVVASSFALVAVVTLVAVILAWRGGRAATWTVMGARVARVAMWGAWGALVDVDVVALAGHAALTGAVVLLLAVGLVRSPR